MTISQFFSFHTVPAHPPTTNTNSAQWITGYIWYFLNCILYKGLQHCLYSCLLTEHCLGNVVSCCCNSRYKKSGSSARLCHVKAAEFLLWWFYLFCFVVYLRQMLDCVCAQPKAQPKPLLMWVRVFIPVKPQDYFQHPAINTWTEFTDWLMHLMSLLPSLSFIREMPLNYLSFNNLLLS